MPFNIPINSAIIILDSIDIELNDNYQNRFLYYKLIYRKPTQCSS